MPLDPTLKRLITKAYLNGFGEIHHYNADEMRQYLTHPRIRGAKAAFSDFLTDQEIIVRCYTPTGFEESCTLPAVIYLSASAFVIDRLNANNDYCSLLANSTGMKIINIAHRLAPEHKYPRFLYDCLDSVRWCFRQAAQLHIDETKMSLWGESSGGTLAAIVTHVLRDQNEKIIQYQTLFYPMVDLVTPYPSKSLYGQGYMLDKSFIAWLDQQGFTPEQDRGCPLVSPLLAKNFCNLPPATIITAEYDPLRDEGILYLQKLISAGVDVTHKHFGNMIHGFMRFYNKVASANEALAFACEKLKDYFLAVKAPLNPVKHT